MIDYEIRASTPAKMLAAAKALGLTRDSVDTINGTAKTGISADGWATWNDKSYRFSVMYYGVKRLATGAVKTNAVNGLSIPVTVAQPGTYAILRVDTDTDVLSPLVAALPASAGVTVKTPLPPDSPIVFG